MSLERGRESCRGEVVVSIFSKGGRVHLQRASLLSHHFYSLLIPFHDSSKVYGLSEMQVASMTAIAAANGISLEPARLAALCQKVMLLPGSLFAL